MLPVMNIIKSAKKSVSQGCINTHDTVYKHRANHSSAVLVLRIHTHEHRTDHSSVNAPLGYEQNRRPSNSVKE